MSAAAAPSARPAAAAASELELIDDFCDQVWLQDGLAAASLAGYRQDLGAWAAWLAQHGKTLHQAQRADVEAYIGAQFARLAKVTSINRRLSSLRRFYQLQLQRGTLKEDPCLRVKAPKMPRRLPKNLSEAQVEALLAAPDCRHAARPARPDDARAVVCERPAGERTGGAQDWDRSASTMGVVRVMGKGSKERLVPFGEEARAGSRAT